MLTTETPSSVAKREHARVQPCLLEALCLAGVIDKLGLPSRLYPIDRDPNPGDATVALELAPERRLRSGKVQPPGSHEGIVEHRRHIIGRGLEPGAPVLERRGVMEPEVFDVGDGEVPRREDPVEHLGQRRRYG